MGRSARKPQGFHDIDGILLLDKPKGLSSNQALQKVRYLFKASKAGHTGSLDPLATGILPICFGQATKFSAYLLDACKSYRATCGLGKTTTTADAEGEITSEAVVDVSLMDVESVIAQFTGSIKQIPPMHSAIKVKGQRLYKLARNGREVEREARAVEIHQLDLVEFEHDRLVVDVRCSKGTYIRTLAEDMGKVLGCGAYLTDLRRTGVHPFWGQHCYSLDELSDTSLDSCLLPVKAALSDFKELIVDETDRENLQQGRAIQADSFAYCGLLNLVTEKGDFIGLGEASEAGLISPKRLMNTAR
ncbi:MAG: tRNA pseudouridine(55) synthase TruB [Gammaproteobacteria bacterium]|nr:tRNA pseudouridine(55) synthase TruB [Gammaproteobacteria bacterium]